MTYSIMHMDVSHIDEICNDIKEQYESGVCDCVLFDVHLFPEGIPAIDKATIEMKDYDLFRDKLASMGLECGILIQCTLGHGRPINQVSSFEQYVGLTTGKNSNVYCPYDDGFREYIYEQAKTLAKHNPKEIMLDDDFRLLRGECGCACALHRKAFQEKTGEKVETCEELKDLIFKPSNNRKKYMDAYIQTQKESLLGMARMIRAGIDSVNPKIQGSFCCCNLSTEHGAEIAKIMAGQNNPVILRLNNGRYCANGARLFSNSSYRFAQQKEYVKNDVDYLLAETDTCPQNRYSTPAVFLHSHYVASILEGAKGAKHWITRLASYEPNSGKAYRKILSKHKGMYNELMEINDSIDWKGCRVPLFKKPFFGVESQVSDKGPSIPYFNCWSSNVLERLGLPVYYSTEQGGVTFIDDRAIFGFTDEELIETLKRTVVLSGIAAKNVQERGLGKYLGVSVHEWKGLPTSGEIDTTTKAVFAVQQKAWELRVESEKTKVLSQIYHLKDGVEKIPLFASVTSYDNELGGKTIVFCGTPDTPFTFMEAFSMLNESRKEQFAKILKESGEIPLYYKDDGDLFLKVGKLPNGQLLCAVFNLNFDVMDEVSFVADKTIISVQRMTADGKKESCEFEFEDGVCVVKSVVYPMQPAILFFETK
ncbi:MAG: hypothetical protein E7373_06805 [Clostridiales bacterium]|nr:hypothetical protein [Clostridiales bacterium]